MPVSAQSPFAVRLAGLPVSAVTSLSADPLARAVRELLALERSVATDGRELADLLHPVIGGLTDAARRPALVGLRRALFHARAPRAAEWSETVRAAVPAALAARIGDWVLRRAQRDRLAAAVPGVLAAESDRTRAALRDVVADPAFRHGLAHSSPTLFTELEKWLADGQAQAPRQVVVRLARYVSRAATKTSPYSTFTTVAAGVWTDASGPLLTLHTRQSPRGLLELHGPVLSELATALASCEQLRPAMLVRTNPSLTRLGDRLAVLGPPPGERIVSVAAMPEVLACTELARAGWSELRRLRARLADHAPAGKVDAFVDRLIELGVLELRLPVEDQCPDWFGALAAWLVGAGAPRWADTARACARLSALLRPPADPAQVHGHRTRLREIRQEVGALRASVPLPADPAGDTAFLHEHGVYPRPAAAASRRRWRAALSDLEKTGRWLAPHDPMLPLRIALAAYFETRFGAGAATPFLLFHRELTADLDRYGAGTLAAGEPIRPVLADLTDILRPGAAAVDYRLPALRSLTMLRLRALAAVQDARPDGDGVVRVTLDPPPSVPGYPDSTRPARSVAWFVQPDGDRLVLNAVMSGYGRGRLRQLYLIAQANGGELPPVLAPSPLSTSDRTGLVADSTGAFGHTLNLRLAEAGHELDYPYTVRLAERRPSVAIGDLCVEHDPATGSLRLRDGRSGALVTPVHNGMVVYSALPRALQLLTAGLGASPGWLLRPADLLPAPADVAVFAPRIEAGLIVLRRATWTVPGGEVPRPAPGEPAAGALLRLHRWLAAHGIPERCFVTARAAPSPRANTPPRAGAPSGGGTSSWRSVAKDRKPLYVDFASPWLTAMFNQMVADAGEVRFCEVLPGLGDPDSRVTELVVETNLEE